ncbi:hypothetical protein PV325_004666 [Microctonus aethiopoides]|uniref:Uncharacterized protein n=1 Tax=Microctonus aethiopoides TaxID=144406 RepID=A0AA39C976_9HYME|nr:hypothetical protein PV325_004666 [Microctonus aethiopoides]KAK0160032.1 hypothetical protein PV328_007478 [Microctonus aethiopoides]
MWTKGEEPPPPPLDLDESMEAPSPSSSVQITEKPPDNPAHLINYKEIMLKNKVDLKKKEEEVQEYAEKLTKIKSKVKLSRRNTVDSSTAGQIDSTTSKKKDNDNENAPEDENISENISEEKAKTPKAKSHLLQKKLAENRRVFEQRNKELNESKRAAEEKVEEIRQQINDTDLSIEKDKKFIELNDKINELQATVIDLQDNLKEKDSVIDSKTRAITLMSEDLSKKGKATLDNLEETKTEMRLMQENFIQLETSFKTKIDHLMNQLNEKEENLERIQSEIESMNLVNAEKDKKIIELEDKTRELNNLIDNKNVESNINEENEKNMEKLKRELEEANKNMIKIKAQHKSKLRNLQKRLENFRTMSDTNAEVIRLENQVALLEEEKGNLQLSLVDFDELKVSNEELHRRINELENTTVTQTNEIQMHIEAIATLENQKLDLIQELHGLKQELSGLENENAESENSRVTAELKIVELEEQLEKLNNKRIIESDNNTITIDNSVESERNEGIDKKSTDSTGSTESFERIMEASDGGIAVLTNEATNNDELARLNERIFYLTQENADLIIKLTKIEEKMANSGNLIEKLNELTIENEKLIDDNRNNFIDKETLLSLESEIVNLKQLIDEKHSENEKLIKHSIATHENSQIQVELNEKIESLENIIDEKNKLIHELENKKWKNDDEINALNEDKYKLNETMAEKVLYYNNLEQELRKNIEKLENMVKNDEEIIRELKEEAIKMQNELEKRRVLIEEYSSEQIKQARINNDLSTANENLILINSDLTRKIDELRSKEKSIIEKIENLEAENREYIREIDERTTAFNSLKFQMNETTKEHSENVESLENKFAEIINDLKERNNQLEQDVKRLNEVIKSNCQELKRKDEILHDIEIKNNENFEHNSELKNHIDNLTIKIDMLNANIMEKENIISQNVAEKTNLQIQLKEEMDKNIEKLSTIEQSYNKLENKLQEEIRKYNEKSDSYEQLLNNMEIQTKHYEDIKQELSKAYEIIEQLKIKYQEDITILNQRSESLICDLNDKTKEHDELKIILDQKEKIIADNFTSENKISLEERISWLEHELEDANNNIQSQFHKMKIIAANLKKKSGQCQEYEIKLREIEENLMIEKQEKEEMNKQIYSLNKIREENEEMLNKISSSLNNAELIIQNEKVERDKLLEEFAIYKEQNSMEIMEKERELTEVKEKARELGVRMQVMETEYLEQLNTINKSETEHRLLLSKLSQVNEAFEVAKVESLELKNKLEQLQSQFDDDKKEKANEINEKMEIINNLMIERDQSEAKLSELSSELQLYREKNEDLMRKAEEINEKVIIINNLMIERDENEIKSKELSSELELYKIKNEELMEKYNKLSEKIEMPVEKQNIEIIKVETSPPSSTEVLFDASKCFGTTSNVGINENAEILSLKKILDDTKNEKKIIEDEYARLNGELNELKLQIDSLKAENEKNKVKIDDNDISEGIKLDEDDEWGWNAKEAEISSNIEHLQPFSSPETQLNAKIAELEDTIKDLNDEKSRLNDEFKLIQVKNGKLIRKLKEYKIQNESLQQQLKIQLSSGGLSDLDSAIEEELRSQVSKLEKILQEVKSDNEKILLERDNCMKRIDVLTAANERFTDMKERQDRDLEVMYIRNNELMKKLQFLEENVDNKAEKLQSNTETSALIASNDNNDEECNKCKEKIAEMQENVELLAAENDELRHLIELEKNKLTEKVHEIEEQKIQTTEELKVNFYDMLEKSHTIEKQCVDTLEETKHEKINLEENYRLDLIAANEKIRELEENIMEKGTIIQNYEAAVENYRRDVNEKMQQLEETNKKIKEIEIHLQNEISMHQEIKNKNEMIESERDECMKTIDDLSKRIIDVEERQGQDLDEKVLKMKENLQLLAMENEEKIIQNYEEKVEKYREDLYEKTQQLEEANRKIEELEKTIENLRSESNDLIVQLRNTKEETERNGIIFNNEIAIKESTIQNLQHDLEINNDKMMKQTGELSELQQQLEEMKINSELNRQKCHELEKKCLENLQDANQENIIVKHTHDLFVADTTEKAREFDKEISISRDKIVEQDENIKLIEENLKVALKDGEKWRLAHQEIEQKLIEVNENLSTVTELLNVRVQEVADLKQYIQKLEFDKLELEKCRSNVDDLNNKLIDKENDITSKIAKYEIEVNEKTQEILKLQSKITILNIERDENNLQLDNQAQEIKSLKELINNSEKLIATLNNEILSKNNELIHLENEKTSCSNEIQRLIIIIGELEAKINEKADEIEQLQNKITELISINEKENEEHKLIGKQLTTQLSIKEEEIEDLKYILNENTYPAIIQQMQNKIDVLYEEKSQLEQSLLPNLKNLSERQAQNVINNEKNEMTNELDVALYMLHQRDVRCEELTHELMQLLEERDTLQLRLSNAIRVNEEIRKLSASTETIKNFEKHDEMSDSVSPIDQQDTPTTDVIIQTPTTSQSADSDEEKKILAQKLSQLHNVGHRKDVRLLDERELRNTQQMSLIAHKDALSTLPPDAAARLINANYTLSRDVQSQSSVLLNWLWGKSTPKVVHM